MVAAIAFFPACAERSLRKEYLQACECGKPEHDVLGCTAGCRAGNAECQNPLCTCERGR